ncbi:MAG TPA: hypothetical protein IAB44_02880 [Candidatus Limivivens intestinipullorum]|uniref:Uncharacterized protein n=1 Tax=Candidatus Limivivens intestinipullorum TaxID=2840858 RepID=A0A9D1ER75_9FIRM|nr:hypothetical protein [Candidatus Limivivens intestinipullorum]
MTNYLIDGTLSLTGMSARLAAEGTDCVQGRRFREIIEEYKGAFLWDM